MLVLNIFNYSVPKNDISILWFCRVVLSSLVLQLKCLTNLARMSYSQLHTALMHDSQPY